MVKRGAKNVVKRRQPRIFGCRNCGHFEFHCLASGCNHYDEEKEERCECIEYEADPKRPLKV